MSRKQVALARMRAVGRCACGSAANVLDSHALSESAACMGACPSSEEGLATPLAKQLSDAFDCWQRSIRLRCSRLLDDDTRHAHGSPPGQIAEEKKEDDAFPVGLPVLTSNPPPRLLVSDLIETHALRKVLDIHIKLCQLDSTLAEELGREGSHAVLSRLIRFNLETEVAEVTSSSFGSDIVQEEDLDTVMELQDLACEIGSLCGGSFPMKSSPYTVEELRARLPLCFSVSSVNDREESTTDTAVERATQHILINQVTARQSAQEDVGFVMWPSAVALSSWVVTNPKVVIGKRVLEIGAGCGLTGLAAAAIAADVDHRETQVILTDFNDTVLQNIDRNIHLNGLTETASTLKLDFRFQTGSNYRGGWIDGSGSVQDAVDVVLAADVICKPEDAVAAANTIYDALVPGGIAIVISADAKHRFGVDGFNDECCRVGLDVQISNVADLYNGGLVSSRGLEQTSGYVEGMTLTMFQVRKPEL